MNPYSQGQSQYQLIPGAVRAGTLQRAKVSHIHWLACLAALLLSWTAIARQAIAGPALVIEMPSGAVLYEDHATEPWYPASLTKLMTVYVALSAVRDHRITLDTPLAVSARAAMMPPSKMGFRPGSLLTLDNALKMLMVKSANDIAVVIAEGVSGSVEGFADDMNEAARSLGLTQSHFVNPNGLPDPDHVSSARDLAILARALYLTFPEQADLFNIGALQLGNKIIRNHNDLLGRYPGADGMKTGFTCAAGFNIVASATQGGRKFIAVILGAPNWHSRAMMAATLFDRAFAGIDKPSKSLADLTAQTSTSSTAGPPDMHHAVCRNRGKTVAQFNAEVGRLMAPLIAAKSSAPRGLSGLMSAQAVARTAPPAARMARVPVPAFDPIPVYLGPPAGYGGLIAEARPPHSPIGTPQPPSSVSAYAPAGPEAALAGAPLSPDAEALTMRGAAKQAVAGMRHDAARRHHLAQVDTGYSDGRAAEKSLAKAPHKASRRTLGKATGKKAGIAKASVRKHSKFAAKPGMRAHPSAKATVHANEATGRKPEKHARR